MFRKRANWLKGIEQRIKDTPYIPSERMLFFPRETDMFIPIQQSMN